MAPGDTRSSAVRPRPLGTRLVVACVAVILSVLLVEGIARVAFPGLAPRTARLTDFWRYGARGAFRSHGVDAQDAQVVINAKGFRSPDHLQLVNQPVEQPGVITRAFTRLAWRCILTQIHRALYEAAIGRDDAHGGAPATKAEAVVVAATVESGAAVSPRLKNWTLTARLLLALAQAVRADGAELLVVFADGIPVAPALTRSLATAGVNSIVLDEGLDRRDPSLHLADELHWNPSGHTRVANALAGPTRETLSRHGR